MIAEKAKAKEAERKTTYQKSEKSKEKQSEAGGAVRQKSDKPEIAEKGKENERKGAMMTNTGSQKSVDPFTKVDTQKELAKVAGVSHDTIHKVETIEKKATPQTESPEVRQGNSGRQETRDSGETGKEEYWWR